MTDKYLRDLRWTPSAIVEGGLNLQAEHPDLGPYGRVKIFATVRPAEGHLGWAGCYTCTASVACYGAGGPGATPELFSKAAELPAPGYGYFATPHEALGAALTHGAGDYGGALVGLIYSEAGWA